MREGIPTKGGIGARVDSYNAEVGLVWAFPRVPSGGIKLVTIKGPLMHVTYAVLAKRFSLGGPADARVFLLCASPPVACVQA